VAVLHLEGLWTRYEDPEPLLQELADLPADKATARMAEIYAEPVKPDLVGLRVRQLKETGAVACGAVTPQRTEALTSTIVSTDLDLLVIQGTVVSAEHVSKNGGEPLNLKRYVRELPIPVIVGGCSSYQAALHLMRTGASGVLVGMGDHGSTSVLGVGVPTATAIADARGARMRHLDETGVYCHVIADGSMATGGDIAKAIACGADSVMIGAPLAAAVDAPGRGFRWGMGSVHPTLPRGERVAVPAVGTLEEIVHELFGGVRTSMAVTGYQTLKEFQKAELVVSGSAELSP
jgi:IMP dehydrogenase